MVRAHVERTPAGPTAPLETLTGALGSASRRECSCCSVALVALDRTKAGAQGDGSTWRACGGRRTAPCVLPRCSAVCTGHGRRSGHVRNAGFRRTRHAGTSIRRSCPGAGPGKSALRLVTISAVTVCPASLVKGASSSFTAGTSHRSQRRRIGLLPNQGQSDRSGGGRRRVGKGRERELRPDAGSAGDGVFDAPALAERVHQVESEARAEVEIGRSCHDGGTARRSLRLRGGPSFARAGRGRRGRHRASRRCAARCWSPARRPATARVPALQPAHGRPAHG